MSKKISTILIAMFFVIIFSVSASANSSLGNMDMDSTVMSIDESICAAYSLEFVEAYYGKIYNMSANDGVFAYKLTTENSIVSDYIKNRNILSGIPLTFEPVNDYKGEYDLYEVQTVGNYIYCEVRCTHSFVYEGHSRGSGSGNPIYFTYVEDLNGEWVLRDIYIDEGLHEYLIRGTAYTLDSYIEKIDFVSAEDVSSVLNSQTEYMSSLQSVFEDVSENLTERIIVTTESSEITRISNNLEPKTGSNFALFDKEAMVDYATYNCSRSIPDSGGSNVTYDYTTFASAGGDCTNFISHCLLAGGAMPVYSGTSGIQASGWFYSSSSYRSSSWSGVSSFYNFVTGYTSLGPQGTGKTLITGSLQDYDCGDIIQLNYIDSINSTDWNHSTIISSFSTGATYIPYITSRTSSSKYNMNKNLYTVYPNSMCKDYRVIILDGYRFY